MTDKKPAAALVLPFGKHKGLTVAEVLAKDPGYAEWLTAQGWLAERFAELHAAIATRGKDGDDTPEHNAMQVKFLDPLYRVACILAAFPGRLTKVRQDMQQGTMEWAEAAVRKAEYDRRQWFSKPDPETGQDYHGYLRNRPDYAERGAEADATLRATEDRLAQAKASLPMLATTVAFEVRGVDVVIREGFGFGSEIGVELKPSMGDDFPAVMRQMQRNNSRVLVVKGFSGTTVAEPLVRQMFGASGFILLFERDIEAEIANARGITDVDPPKR